MDDTAQKIVTEQLAKLPEAVRRAIAQSDMRARLQSVAKKNGLRIDQAGVLEDETTLVLLGLEHPDAFVGNLVGNGHLSREAAVRVASDVNDQIFKEIRHVLVAMHEKETAQGEIPDAPPPAATPTYPSGVSADATASPAPATAPTPPVSPPSSATRTLGTDIAQAKLSGSVHLAPDAVRMKEPPIVPPAPQGIRAITKPPPPVENGTYTAGSDPYREPTK